MERCQCGHAREDHVNGIGPCLAGMAYHCHEFVLKKPRVPKKKKEPETTEEIRYRMGLGPKPGTKTSARLPNGDLILFEGVGGRVVELNQPEGRTDLRNYLIVCEFGNWSGFRTLEECRPQFDRIVAARDRPDGFYRIVERF
jgi:hypothetical protein